MNSALRSLARLFRLPVRAPAPPIAPGPRDGALAPCPPTRNCVSSQASDPVHAIEPLPDLGGREATLARVREVLRGTGLARVVSEADGYLRAEFTSRVFRFVDDVEFLWSDQERVLHVRSASRVGRGDLGANRRRLERIRAHFIPDSVH